MNCRERSDALGFAGVVGGLEVAGEGLGNGKVAVVMTVSRARSGPRRARTWARAMQGRNLVMVR